MNGVNSGQDQLPDSRVWRRYTVLIWLFRAGAVLWLPLEGVIEHIGWQVFAKFVYPPLFAIVWIPTYLCLLNFSCPRCRNAFFAPGGWRNAGVLLSVLFLNRCQTCGLRSGEGLGRN